MDLLDKGHEVQAGKQDAGALAHETVRYWRTKENLDDNAVDYVRF